MEVLFKQPRKYDVDIPKGSKIVNTLTDSGGEDWVTWVEFGVDPTDSGDKSVTIRTLSLSQTTNISNAESIVLYEDDYNKLIGKK